MNKKPLLVIFISILALFGAYGVSCASTSLIGWEVWSPNWLGLPITGSKATTTISVYMLGYSEISLATFDIVNSHINGSSVVYFSGGGGRWVNVTGYADGVYQANSSDGTIVVFSLFSGVPSFQDYIPIQVNSGVSISMTSQTYINNPINFTGTYINTATYDQINLNIISTSYGQTLFIPNIDIVLGNGVYLWNKNINMPYTGNYTVQARLYESSTGSTTLWSNSVSFGLASTTEVLNGNISTTTVGVLGTEICDILDVACHLKNVLIVLFQPSTASVSQLVGYKTQIQNKPPFGYITILVTNLGNLSTTTATSSRPFNITIPTGLNDLIFNPLRVGLNALLWFVGLVWLYNRLKHIQL